MGHLFLEDWKRRWTDGEKRFRAGYTTGTCAQAATKAAVWMLLSGEEKTSVDVVLPKGKELTLLVCEIEMKGREKRLSVSAVPSERTAEMIRTLQTVYLSMHRSEEKMERKLKLTEGAELGE